MFSALAQGRTRVSEEEAENRVIAGPAGEIQRPSGRMVSQCPGSVMISPCFSDYYVT